jgi:3,4-dihydroxy 2-butanone 4-phosphate synthase/GTP cyclohydrolase II
VSVDYLPGMTTGISALERARTLNALAEQDGTMKRLPDLMRFADEHDLPIISIESLIRYRTENDVLLERTATTTMRLGDSELTAHVYRTIFQDKFITAVVKGDIEGSKPTVVRFVKGPRDRDLLSSAIVPGNVVHR